MSGNNTACHFSIVTGLASKALDRPLETPELSENGHHGRSPTSLNLPCSEETQLAISMWQDRCPGICRCPSHRIKGKTQEPRGSSHHPGQSGHQMTSAPFHVTAGDALRQSPIHNRACLSMRQLRTNHSSQLLAEYIIKSASAEKLPEFIRSLLHEPVFFD